MQRIAALGLGLVIGLAACGGDEPASAPEVLKAAKATLDRASSVHFVLTSTDIPPGGTRLVGGEGTVARPDAFRGNLKVGIAGALATVEVVSVGGTVYAELPFTSGYEVVDPSSLGLSDPADLIDPATGITRLLTELNPTSTPRRARIGSDVVAEIRGTVPGAVVADLLTAADPDAPVEATVSVVDGSAELRRAVLTGAFYEPGTPSTFTLDLDRYGEQVTISAPTPG